MITYTYLPAGNYVKPANRFGWPFNDTWAESNLYRCNRPDCWCQQPCKSNMELFKDFVDYMHRPRHIIEDSKPEQLKLALDKMVKRFPNNAGGMRDALNWACSQIAPPDGKGALVQDDPDNEWGFNITGPKGKGEVVKAVYGGGIYWVATVPDKGGDSNEA